MDHLQCHQVVSYHLPAQGCATGGGDGGRDLEPELVWFCLGDIKYACLVNLPSHCYLGTFVVSVALADEGSFRPNLPSLGFLFPE